MEYFFLFFKICLNHLLIFYSKSSTLSESITHFPKIEIMTYNPYSKTQLCPFEINNYRLISLINTMSKTLKSKKYTGLIWPLQTYNLLFQHQFGFRKNRSTIDPLTTIHTNICDGLNKNHLLIVSLDIAKAYDTVQKHRVLSILHKWNLKDNIFKCLS